MEVFMDHSNRSSAAVNHQIRKPRANHGKPEWQKSAIRTCGYWSEQLSSRGKIYFYNCVTEVSQWQKPVEWNLPDMSRKDLLKLLNERKIKEDVNLKRPHPNHENDLQHPTDRTYMACDSGKRAKCSVSDVRKPSSSQMESSLMCQTNDSLLRMNSTQGNMKSDFSGNHITSLASEQWKKAKTHSYSLVTANDDMEISPNSSPLSDGSSKLCSASKSQSPQVHNDIQSTSPFSFQRPQTNKPKTLDNMEKSDRASTTLCKLMDAIRASIDLLDQSPNTQSSRLDGNSPSLNGTVFPISKVSSGLCKHKNVLCEPAVSKVHGYLHNTTHKSNGTTPYNQMSSKDTSLERDSSYSYPRSESSQTTSGIVSSNVHDTTQKDVLNVLDISKQSYTLKTPSPLITLVPECRVSTRHSVAVNSTIHNSPPVITIPSSSNTATSSSISTSRISTSLRHGCALSSHMDELLKMLAHRSSQGTRTASEASPKTAPALVTDLKETISPTADNRAHLNPSVSRNANVHKTSVVESDTPGPRSQYTQLNDLVQVLKAALHQQSYQSIGSRTTGSLCPVQVPQESRRTPISEPKDRSSNEIGDTSQKHPMSHNRYQSSTEMATSPTSERNYLPDDHAWGKCNTVVPITMVSDFRDTAAVSSPNSFSPSSRTSQPISTTTESATKLTTQSPVNPSENGICTENITSSLDSEEVRVFCEPALVSKYYDETLLRLEQEAHLESKNFDRLQSVLYAELSAESKKLRALVRISESKLALHREKQNSLQELMDAIETRKHLPNLSFVDDVL